MDGVRLDELIRAWLETWAHSPHSELRESAARALALHDELSAGGAPAEGAAATRIYVALIENLTAASQRCASRIHPQSRRTESGTAREPHLFWDQALNNLKAYCEAKEAPRAAPRRS